MPKALSSLQSDQRSYTSEFSVGESWYPRSSWRELVSEELLGSCWGVVGEFELAVE
jgi:hypothetical protein